MQAPNFKKIFKKISFKKRGEFRTIGEKADHDWKYILLGFFFLTAVSFGVGLYVFVKINKGEIFTINETSENSQKTINQKELNEASTFFKDRQNHFFEIQSNPAVVQDPSL